MPMTDGTMIERVARALWADRHPDDEWAAEDERDYLGHARAAIEAMREPSDDMLEAGWGRGGTPADIWPAMIDAALSRNPT